MQDQPYRLIPLRRVDKTVRGWVVVDPDGYDRISLWKWGLRSGRVGRVIYEGGRMRDHLLAWEVLGLESGRICFLNGDRLDHRRANLAPRPAPFVEGGYGYVPLCSRINEVVAWTTLDASVFARIAQRTWTLCKGGKGSRTMYALRRAPEFQAASYGMHREIMGLAPGDSRQIDHINGHGLDNRQSNLRVVPGSAANNQNVGRSRYRGVGWDKEAEAWRVQVRIEGASTTVGRYKDRETAAEVSMAVRRLLLPYSIYDAEPPPPLPAAATITDRSRMPARIVHQ